MLGRKKRKSKDEESDVLEEQLGEARTQRADEERKRDQEKEAVISRLKGIEERNDLVGLIAEIFGTNSHTGGNHA